MCSMFQRCLNAQERHNLQIICSPHLDKKEALLLVTQDAGKLPLTLCRSQWRRAMYHSFDNIISSLYGCRMKEVFEYIKVNIYFVPTSLEYKQGISFLYFPRYNMKFYESTCKMFVWQLAILEISSYATSCSLIVFVYTGKASCGHTKFF